MNQDASSGPQDKRLRAVITEYKRRRESGQTVDQQAFLKAYPELADGLKQFFQGEASSLNPALASTKLGKSPGQDMSVRETAHPGKVESDTASEFTARMFGRYQLLRPLGEGAMGSVFLAQDTHLDRRVALKMPRSSAADKMKDRGEFLARFTREAKAAAGLKHTNICSVYDAGEIDGTAYITMDFIDGVPLSQLVGTDRLMSVSDVIRIIRVIADAVMHAHQKGIVHRDLKPGNILVDDQMSPFVTDFGLARRDSSSDGSRITQEGLLIGTPAYMAPEQVRGEQTKVGAVSDIYSLGVIFFELLTGRLPFEGSMPEMLAKVLRDPPPVPSRLRPDLTEDVDDVVWKMLLKEPDRRYPSMLDVITAIDKLFDKLQQATSRETTVSARATTAAAQSPFEIQKSHIELMLKKGQYAGAIRDLEALAEEKSPAAKLVVEWARKTLPNAKKEAKALSPSGLAAMLKTAEQMFEKCDYQGCIQLLDDVPSLKRSEAMETLLQKAQQREAAAEELMEQIRDKERRENPEGLEALVKKYLKLKPGNAYAKKLMQALQTYSKTPAGRRRYRFERGRLQPMPEISFFRQYALLAVLVGVLSFLATYASVIVYLKGGSQTIAVHVDDEWLREQGGELTLVVDGDEHTISTSPSNGEPLTIVVKVGDREFSVKHGDTVVHDPRTFTIEHDGKSVLQITPTDIELRNSPLIASELIGGDESGKSGNPSAISATETNGLGPWIDLFDGKDTSRWQTLGQFQVEDGVLIARSGKTVAVSKDEFADFELEVEWRLSGTAPNGGIYYRELPTTQYEGNEYQIIDPAHQLANTPLVRTGALYGVLPTKEGFEKPLGEWNFTKIVCRGPVVEHWMNNELLFTYDTTSAEWKTALGGSFLQRGKDRIGTARKGYILLQAQKTGEVAYRNVRIRELSGSPELTSSFNQQSTDLDKIATGTWKPLTVDQNNAHAPDKMTWKDGILRIEEQNYVIFPETTGSNIAVRAEVRKKNSRGGGFNVRRKRDASVQGGVGLYTAWFEDSGQSSRNVCGLHRAGSPWALLAEQKSATNLEADTFIPMAVVAKDDRIMVFINGKKEIDVTDATYRDGYVALDAWLGAAEFRNPEYQFLDEQPTSDLDKVATGQWKPLLSDKTILPRPEKMSWKDGVLEINRDVLRFPEIDARNIVVRAEIRRFDNESGDISLRDHRAADPATAGGTRNVYMAVVRSSDKPEACAFGIQKSGAPWKLLSSHDTTVRKLSDEFVSIAFAAIDDRLMIFHDGKKIVETADSEFSRGAVSLSSWLGRAQYRNVEYQILDEAAGVATTTPTVSAETGRAPFDSDYASKLQQAWSEHLKVPVEWTNSVGVKFRLIPPGEFTIGSSPDEIKAAKPQLTTSYDEKRPDRADSEGPQQRITISKPFYLGLTEITQSQYQTVTGVNPSHYQRGGEGADKVGDADRSNAPVELVSWLDTGIFCDRLSSHEGFASAYHTTPDMISLTGSGGYRLPTEAEWEYACRAGTETLYSSGNDEGGLKEVAWTAANRQAFPQPVATRKANPFGLYDMHGNAWEWVHDSWRANTYELMTGAGALDPRCDLGSTNWKVIRGGAFHYSTAEARSACRDAYPADNRWHDTGFRVAVSVDAVRQKLVNAAP